MVGIYVGATSGYSGKNMIAMGIGLKLQKEGYRVGYMKPVGALPQEKNGVLGDADAFFVQDILGLSEPRAGHSRGRGPGLQDEGLHGQMRRPDAPDQGRL
jgi:dethiobiotin synthetase